MFDRIETYRRNITLAIYWLAKGIDYSTEYIIAYRNRYNFSCTLYNIAFFDSYIGTKKDY